MKNRTPDPAQVDMLDPNYRAPETHEQVVRRHTRTVKGPAPVRNKESLKRTLSLYEQQRADLIAKLRQAARDAYTRLRRPISSNDVRYVLDAEGYEGDFRIMGSVFPPKEWKPVGTVKTDSKLSHPHDIKTFIPREVGE